MQIVLRKQQMPWLMAAARATFGPIVVLGQACQWSGIALASLIVAALLSDIFDGILARRWHCDTPSVRLFDSMADTVFYLGVATALYLRYPQLLHTQWPLFSILLATEALHFIFAIAKFGKPASYHSYLAKTWGLLLAVAVVTEFATAHAATLIAAALALGILCNVEGLAMSIMLPTWCNDVKTLRVAVQLRHELLSNPDKYPRSCSDPEGSTAHPSKHGRVMVMPVLFIMIVCTLPARAFQPNQALYVNGTIAAIPVRFNRHPQCDPAGLSFTMPTQPTPSLHLELDKIQSVTYTAEVTHHLGVLPAIVVGLLQARQRQHRFSFTYVDDTGTTQNILIELSKTEASFLIPLLRSRAHACNTTPTHCNLPPLPIVRTAN